MEYENDLLIVLVNCNRMLQHAERNPDIEAYQT